MVVNIYSRKGKQVTCDNCLDGFEAEDWQHAIEIMNDKGWTRKRVNGVMCHLCPECQEEDV